jgi:heme/copper-type cytochrome/quinol oxidase subunit 2
VWAQNDSVGGVQPPGGSTLGAVKAPPAQTAPAAQTSQNTQLITLKNPLQNVTSLGQLVQTFADIFTYLVVLFAIIMLIWVGLQYVLARGNSEKMKENSQRLLWIVIGIAIVIGARVLVQVVINTMQATGAINSNVINNANKAVQGQ